MSAEVLRRAADRLDALADAATPGPWTCYGDHFVWPSERGPAANDPILAMVGEAHQDSAAYIATMHPAVAKPLAKWLRTEAVYGAGLQQRFQEALTLARAVLGEEVPA